MPAPGLGWQGRTWWRCARAFSLTVLGVVQGCLPHVSESHVNEVSSTSSGQPPARAETRRPDVAPAMELDGETMIVTVEATTECSVGRRSAKERRFGTARHLDHGVAAQTLNASVAVGLGALGIYAMTTTPGDCTQTPEATTANPSPVSRQCTAEERKDQESGRRGIGALSLIAGVAAAGVFVANVVRASDDVAVTKEAGEREAVTPWKVCARHPLRGLSARLNVADETLEGKTDEVGVVKFDLAAIGAVTREPATASVEISLPTGEPAHASISLTATKLYANWVKGKAAADGQAKLEQRRRELAASAAAMQEERDHDTLKWNTEVAHLEESLRKLEAVSSPWTEAEVGEAGRLSDFFVGMLKRAPDAARSEPKILGLLKRMKAIDVKREQAIERATAARAAREAALLPKAAAFCTQCCLMQDTHATRDGCSARCEAAPATFALIRDGELRCR